MSLRSKLARPFIGFAALSSLALLFLLCLCLIGILQHRFIPSELGWSSSPSGDGCVIRHVDSNGAANGKLQPGDVILSLDGSPRAAAFGQSLAGFQPVSSYSITVLRHGKPIRQTLLVRKQPDETWRYCSYFLLALLNFVLAVWIAGARPDYAVAQIAFFFFLSAARTFASAVLYGFEPPLAGFSLWFVLLSASSIWQPLQWAVGYDFALRFPEPLRQPRLLRALRLVFYALAIGLLSLTVLTVLPNLLGLPDRASLLPSWFPMHWYNRAAPAMSDVLGAISLSLAPFILLRNYRALPDPLARRRVRWAAFGIAVEIIPVALGVAIAAGFRAAGSYSAYELVESFLDNFAAVFSSVGPIALAYAIVRHRILGIRVIIRQGLQYLLARNVLRLLFWFPLIAIAVDLLRHPRQPVADFLVDRSWWFYLFLIASTSLTFRYRGRLQSWVERKFFRSAYEEEVILSELIDALHACESSDDVARAVSLQLEESLHPASVTVLYRKEPAGLFTVGFPQDQPIGLEFRGILNERVQDALQSHRSARTFTEIAELLEEKQTTSSEQILKTLLTPISGANGHLIGVLVLGEKRSEQSYSQRDRRLLKAVAVQMGLIFEMLSLREQVREEGRVRLEVLGRLDQENIQLLVECPKCGACNSSPASVCEIDGSTLGMTLPVERVIDSKYRLERRIGTGGMGAVYEASDLRLDRLVAVKVMTGRLFGNTSALRRFEREARAAARLQHQNIVAIYDFGTVRGGGAYLVMQRIFGPSWRAELNRAGHVSPKRAAPWFDQLCDAVACAHTQGIVHRDLKPENLLLSLTSEGTERVTVLDFGVAKLREHESRAQPQLTSLDRVIGTYGYMSPEQRSGGNVDHRSDIYSVGVMMIEALTNNRPPATGVTREWLEEALQWHERTPECDSLLNLLHYALQESADDRPSTIYDLQHELIPLLYNCPPPLVIPSVGMTGSETETRPF